MTAGLLRAYPDTADAVVFETLGYYLNGPVTFEASAPRVAATVSPDLFSGFDTGYLTWSDVFTNVNLYV